MLLGGGGAFPIMRRMWALSTVGAHVRGVASSRQS